MASLAEEDRAKVLTLLDNISKSMTDVTGILKMVVDQKENALLPTEKGYGILELKNQMMISYMINLIHLMYEKVSGSSVEGSPDVERLVEIRTVLEKLRPLEKKYSHEFDRKIKAARTGVVDENDPMSFKPDPKSLLSESDDEGPDVEETKKDNSVGVYKPSKSNPTYFDESGDKKRHRQDERAKKRLLNSTLMQDLIHEYTDAPEETSESSHKIRDRKAEKREQERTEYEETYMTRLPITKTNSSKKRKFRGKNKGGKRSKTH